MIHVPRADARPDGLNRLDASGTTETDRARQSAAVLLQNGNIGGGATADQIRAALAGLKVAFTAYKQRDVKAGLTAMFGRKCAYCESTYAGTQPMDVEHFRPKGAVVNEQTRKAMKPGYYWLAAEWDNLLPSCIDCNRRRTHDGDTPMSVGKANRFPLVDEATRTVWHDQADREQPLLLNPAVDTRIDEHLRFREDGTVVGLTDRGEASIDVYGLMRPALVSDRRQVARIVDLRLDLVGALGDARSDLRGPPTTERRESLRLLIEDVQDRLLRELQAMMDADQPFAGMCRQLIRASGAPDVVVP